MRFLRFWRVPFIVLFILVGYSILASHFSIGIGVTSSLPYHLYIIQKFSPDKLPVIHRGDLIVFKWPNPQISKWFNPEFNWVKIVLGVPGDEVSIDGLSFSINGETKGKLATYSAKGIPLVPGPSGVIPPDHYFVYAPHPLSCDSRYAIMGWIPRSWVIGIAHVIF